MDRFKQLKQRARDVALQNRKEVLKERQDKPLPGSSVKVERAREQLARITAEQEGKDFERLRALDWTAEEAERWQEKQSRIKTGGFENHQDTAVRAYEKEMAMLEPDLARYMERKTEADDPLAHLHHKPERADVDRLVDNLKAGDERRMKRRKKNSGDHVSYINDKNRQFNEKLARHYDQHEQGQLKEALDESQF